MPIIDIATRRPAPRPATGVVSQERLKRGLELLREEVRIARELREYVIELEADLRAGAEVEAGELIFDRELKIARRRNASPTSSFAVRRQ